MPLIRRLINVRFQLGQTSLAGDPAGAQSFGPGGSDVVTVSGLRVSANITKAGTTGGALLSMQIFGMRLDLMNKLATLGMVYAQIRRNTVTVLAGDEGSPLATAFIGTIQQAWIDFTNAPEVAFHVEAQTSAAEAVITPDPAFTSIQGGADVVQLMKSFADQMHLNFENNGISGLKISYPYLYGPIVAQAQAVAHAAGINWFVDNGVLAIWKRGSSRGGTIPLINPRTGLVGYPSFTSYGIMLKTLFNNDIKFNGRIKVESSLEGVTQLNPTGEWAVYNIDHQIESQMPHGNWFTTLTCYNPQFPSQLGSGR